MNRLLLSVCASAIALQFPANAIAKARERVVHSFATGTDGAHPSAGLIDANGTLYGTTSMGGAYSNGGTVFSVNVRTGTETVLHSFGSGADALNPTSGLVDVNGALYGTTPYGGANNGCVNGSSCGTVYAVNKKTGAETVVYSFCSQQDCADGEHPVAALIYVKGKLYGTALEGGATGINGKVFSISLKTGKLKVLHSFGSGTDGQFPLGSLIYVNGTLYGTTEFGGSGSCNVGGISGCGTVFSVDTTTGAEKVIYTFLGGTDGSQPVAGLIDVKGTLYGTTAAGGASGNGTAFSVNPGTGAETVLHSFAGGVDGSQPVDALVDVEHKLYGTTLTSADGGTVFSVDPKSGTEKVVYSFCSLQNCTDGHQPEGGLIDLNGTLFGTTAYGGANDDGTVFALKKP